MATLNDVARRAAVTPATVSNVLSGRVKVRDSTRARVLAAIKELDYRPNLMARGLTQGRSYVLALLLTDIANPFYAELAREIERIAQTHDYHLLVCDTSYNVGTGRDYLRDLADRRVDGLIVMGGSLSIHDIHKSIGDGQRLVLCNWEEDQDFLYLADGGSLPPAVGLDFTLGGALAARHLIDLGHRRIAVIVQAVDREHIKHISRFSGFRSALDAAAMALDAASISCGDSSIESGYAAAATLLAQNPRPTAIFASNDLMAIGALNAAYDHGLRVPEDLSVIGFDNIHMSMHVRPALTTIGIPARALATEAMELLLRCMAGQDEGAFHLSLRPSLVVRSSTGHPALTEA